MSNRSYPADFSRPLREVPVATDEDVQRMLERLRRRCKIGKTSSQIMHEEARPRAELSLDLAPASSADTPTSAGGLHVSATADKTACAGGGSNGVSCDSGSPFQPTRPAPNNQGPLETAGCARWAESTATLSSNQASPVSYETVLGAAMPRGSLPNSLGGPGSGCEVDADASIAPSVPVLIWERVSPTAMRTTCGTWICCKVTVMGKPQYELFRRIAGLERPTRILPSFETFADASKAAQDELDHVG